MNKLFALIIIATAFSCNNPPAKVKSEHVKKEIKELNSVEVAELTIGNTVSITMQVINTYEKNYN